MGRKFWMERFKESLPKSESGSDSMETKKENGGISIDKADEIVGFLYAGIGELEIASLELSKASSQKKMERSLKQIRFISERITCYLRNTVAELGMTKDEDNVIPLIKGDVSFYEVEITCMPYGYRITCPFRLPSKNTYRVNEYWWKWIEGAVRTYRGERYEGELKHALLVYVDVYPKDYPACRFTDADNQDIKKVTDCLREVFLKSDDSLHLWILQMGCAEEVDKPYSKIYLVDRERLAFWAQEMDFPLD